MALGLFSITCMATWIWRPRRAKANALVATVLFCMAGRAHADGMRCGHRLVSEGDSPQRVEARCGPPVSTRAWSEWRAVQVKVGNVWMDRTVEFKYEEWTYDSGPDRLVRYVVFENGRLVAVNTGRYGEGL